MKPNSWLFLVQNQTLKEWKTNFVSIFGCFLEFKRLKTTGSYPGIWIFIWLRPHSAFSSISSGFFPCSFPETHSHCFSTNYQGLALFNMPNSNQFNISSILIFSEISLSISIFSKISLSNSISIFFRIVFIDIDILQNPFFDIDINIFQNGLINIDSDIFQICRYI